MQVVKGILSSGRFTPTDGAVLPKHVKAVLVFDEKMPAQDRAKAQIDSLNKFNDLADDVVAEEMQARTDWLNLLRQARELTLDEPLLDFPTRQPMREPHGLVD